MHKILELQHIKHSYPQGDGKRLHILHDVSLTLHAGEIVALMGRSGAGKSTLLHMAGLLDTPEHGSVLLEDQIIIHHDDATRTKLRQKTIGFIYQFHHLLPEFSALENVMLPQIAAGVSVATAKKWALELLDSVQLTSRKEHRPSQLSGGEQQRVAIARALANKPKLLLADEPTGNLDPETAEVVFEVLINVIREQGVAALIATHNPELAARMDRLFKLERGYVVSE
jgi:lipoprotein-releasing system ATP-binding protein